MNVIKRNGTEVPFNPQNIINAVTKANNSIDDVSKRMSALQIRVIEEQVEKKLMTLGRAAHIEEIQDLVIHAIMAQQAYEVAQHYTEYRYKKALIRKSNSTDDAILALVDYENEDMKQENSNKNPTRFNPIINPESNQKRRKEVLQHMLDQNYITQDQYDEAWRCMRVSSYTDFILTKIQRVKEMEDSEGDVLVSEGIDSNYMDIINYAVFGAIKLSGE